MLFAVDCDIQRGPVRAFRTIKVAADGADDAIRKAREEASLGEGTLVRCMNVLPISEEPPATMPTIGVNEHPKRETLSLKKAKNG